MIAFPSTLVYWFGWLFAPYLMIPITTAVLMEQQYNRYQLQFRDR